MKNINAFDTIRQEGRLLYEYVRGSQLYGLNTPNSDRDTGGVYLCTADELFGLHGYKPQVSDDRHDNTWYEVGELMRLLSKSNPTMLELLYVPESKVLAKHPIMQMILDNRDEFLTRQCFNPFFGYAKSQIEKARGLNKKIVNPIKERLSPYDFIYTFQNQGSTRFRDWLVDRGLKQQHCGLVNIPNMHDVYGVYYDFGAHCECEGWRNDGKFLTFCQTYFACAADEVCSVLDSEQPIGYRGVIDEHVDAGDIRLSSISKDVRPICYICYNKSGYTTHTRQYSEYQRWVRERNETRYNDNLDKNYDSKNMMHCFRMIHMAQEIASGEGMVLERDHDHDFLMDIRAHKYEYDELITLLDQETAKMNHLMETSTIREKIDEGVVNQLLIDIRRKQLGSIKEPSL